MCDVVFELEKFGFRADLLNRGQAATASIVDLEEPCANGQRDRHCCMVDAAPTWDVCYCDGTNVVW